MLHSINELKNYLISAEDGEIGRCKNFLFDDHHWAIRYMVVDTRKWLPGRKVLVSPIALGKPDWDARRFPVQLTRQEIKDSPPLDEDAPVSRQYESSWFDYYGWPYYWFGGGIWGASPYPTALFLKRLQKVVEKGLEPEESHLRSVNEVTGYQILSKDGKVGHAEDFLVEEETWVFRYIVINIHDGLPQRKVLVAPTWVTWIDWISMQIRLELTAKAMKKSLEYDPSVLVDREYEVLLHDYYGRPKHWE
jgi:hypothetical protein